MQKTELPVMNRRRHVDLARVTSTGCQATDICAQSPAPGRFTSDERAVSIHAYSPRLTSMTFHDLTSGGPQPNRTVETDEPEL